ncbi:hypothetical protein GW17_00057900, partial [Ensete ventricosum]
GKGKEPIEVEEVLERGYSIRDLCEVEDRARANGYFTSVMTRLNPGKGEELLMPRWSLIPGSAWVWTEGPLAMEYLRGALHPVLAKQFYECSSEELMNRAAKSTSEWRPCRSGPCRGLTGSTPAREHHSALNRRASQEVVATTEHQAKELQATVNQLRVELGSSENRCKNLEQEVDTLRSSLQGAWDNQAHLEEDMLLLTEAIALLEKELKTEGP